MKDTELIKRHEVKGTPFMIVETKEHGVFIHMGMYRVSKVYRTVKECRTIIKMKPWELIMSVMYAIATDVKNEQPKPTQNEEIPVPDGATRVLKHETNSSN